MCALGEEHTKECDILSRRKDKKIIDDFTEPSKIYWVITTLRCLHWRKKPLKIYTKYFRLRATAGCLNPHKPANFVCCCCHSSLKKALLDNLLHSH